MRVLSLFDGISCGYFVLTSVLKVKVEKYFSSEIDGNAIRVQHHNHSDKLTMLGCVKKLQEREIDNLGHVDLVLGGSPCDQLSLVNWRRKGLHDESDSGVLFKEFVRILDYLKVKAASRGTELFWLFENTAHMERSVKEEMSRSLKSEPVQICASLFVPMARKRNYWGNLPGMHDIPLMPKTSMTLQRFLRPHRAATVSCLPTLTSNITSQLSGSEKLAPIVYDGESEYLSINEMELIFGFNEHYTDCDNISVCQRRKLVGKSWSVHVIAELLKPLAAIFATDE
ncbi:hypothetical protein ONE63_011147 [Megalurothrips usitatus]|uniref:DNA (cytosine-5-)-methyltransferase n=1 Tax=Megalurothrips usitatus TaxID=439358 RepID=A0AAV7XM15_9NEOP|nr:hypothetical protein ONE63_011147 [Megalurothrips usitatus]